MTRTVRKSVVRQESIACVYLSKVKGAAISFNLVLSIWTMCCQKHKERLKKVFALLVTMMAISKVNIPINQFRVWL